MIKNLLINLYLDIDLQNLQFLLFADYQTLLIVTLFSHLITHRSHLY